MSGADFNTLLRSTAFEAPKPRNFPEGTYKGTIKDSPKLGEKIMQERPKIVITFNIKATDWPDEIDESAKENLSLQGKTWQKDFIIDKEKLGQGDKTDLWPLDQFLRSMGMGTSGGSYEEILPNCVGAEVQFQLGLRSYKSKTTNEMEETNDVKRVTGLA